MRSNEHGKGTLGEGKVFQGTAVTESRRGAVPKRKGKEEEGVTSTLSFQKLASFVVCCNGSKLACD